MFDFKVVLTATIGFALVANSFAIDPPAGNEPRRVREDIAYRRSLGHTKVITALAYTPNSKILISAGLDGKVRLWDAEATKVLRTLDTSSLELYAIAISPDGNLLASAGAWQEIQIWEIATGKLLHTLKGHSAQVAALAFSPDGKLLASGGYDKSIRLWDTGTWKEKLKITKDLDRVTSLAFSPDGRTLASAGTTTEKVRGYENGVSDKARLWSVETGMLSSELSIRASRVAFLPDGGSIVTSGVVMRYTQQKNGRIAIDGYGITTWRDLVSGQQYLNTFKQNVGEIVTVSPDGRTLATGHGYGLFIHLDGNVIRSDRQSAWGVCLWEAASCKSFVRLENTVELPQRYETDIAFSADGRRLAISYFSGAIEVRGLDPRMANPLPAKSIGGRRRWDQIWKQLASADSEDGYAAVIAFVLNPSQTIKEFSSRMQPVPPQQHEEVRRQIIDLGDTDYAVRKQAEQRLRKAGLRPEPAIRAALHGSASAEVRKRLVDLLVAMHASPVPGERLREIRAVGVLETIGTEEARRLLKTLAAGAPGAALTEDAKAAMKHLER